MARKKTVAAKRQPSKPQHYAGVPSDAAHAPQEHPPPLPVATRSDTAWWEENTPIMSTHTDDRGSNGTDYLETRTVETTIDPQAGHPATAVERAATEAAAGREEAQMADLEEDGTRQLTKSDQPLLAAQRSRLGFSAAALRDIGRVRSSNQDSLFAMITTLPREDNDISVGLFIVADGMGGHSGGEIASNLAISTVVRYILSELVVPALTSGRTEALQPLIISAVQEANRAIWEQSQAMGSDMGTTCTVALVLGRGLYIGHVGDSRAYLVSPTGMRQLTTDHSTVGRLIQLGQLDPSEAREHPLRSQLYRTVGQMPEVLVDFIYQPIGDATHLLLGSDGLWGMLDEEVLLDVLENNVWPHDACRELIARANLAGGEDNISAVVATLPTA